jgi:hypothetical protein
MCNYLPWSKWVVSREIKFRPARQLYLTLVGLDARGPVTCGVTCQNGQRGVRVYTGSRTPVTPEMYLSLEDMITDVTETEVGLKGQNIHQVSILPCPP